MVESQSPSDAHIRRMAMQSWIITAVLWLSNPLLAFFVSRLFGTSADFLRLVVLLQSVAVLFAAGLGVYALGQMSRTNNWKDVKHAIAGCLLSFTTIVIVIGLFILD